MRIETQNKWRTLIQQQSDGDLTISQFCKVKRISPTCFFKYRKILQTDTDAESRNAFVKIRSPKVTSRNEVIKIQYHHSTLSLPTTIAPDWIANLLKALG